MFLEADPVVFIDIVLYVDPQRVEDALKTREKKKPGGILLFLHRRNNTKRPSGH